MRKARPDFPTIDRAQWRKAVEAKLPSKDIASLTTKRHDGLTRKPLYTTEDAIDAGAIGSFPYLRGTQADAPLWHIGQRVIYGREAADNRAVLDDLGGGASAILLDLTASMTPPDAGELARLLDGVLLDAAPIALVPSENGLADIAAFAEYLKAQKTPPAQIGGAFGYDPLGGAARFATPPDDMPIKDALALTQDFSAMQTLCASGLPFHLSGAGAPQELALTLASFLAYLRAQETQGIALEQAWQNISLSLAADPDFFVTIAKLRAMRTLIANIARGAQHNAPPPAISMEISDRHYTLTDPWVNILRGTCGALGAALGGAQMIILAPYSAVSAGDSALTRRIARNTQLILQEESHIGQTADAAGGSWYVENLTGDLARRAWDRFQHIEQQGGLAAALASGEIADELNNLRAAETENLAQQRTALIGLSAFARADERLDTPRPPIGKGALAEARPAARFEALRLAAAPARPRVFLANLGRMADFTARANFASNLYAAGGIAAIGGAAVADISHIAALFSESGAKIAVICGDDQAYAAHAAPVAAALHEAGAVHIALVGQTAAIAHIDAYCSAACDALGFLTDIHAALGLGEAP